MGGCRGYVVVWLPRLCGGLVAEAVWWVGGWGSWEHSHLSFQLSCSWSWSWAWQNFALIPKPYRYALSCNMWTCCAIFSRAKKVNLWKWNVWNYPPGICVIMWHFYPKMRHLGMIILCSGCREFIPGNYGDTFCLLVCRVAKSRYPGI